MLGMKQVTTQTGNIIWYWERHDIAICYSEDSYYSSQMSTQISFTTIKARTLTKASFSQELPYISL